MVANNLEESIAERVMIQRSKQLVTLKQIKLYCAQASIAAVERLILISQSDDDVIALRAIEMILNRGFGLPKEHIEITEHKVISRDPLTADQWEKLYGSGNEDTSRNRLGSPERTPESVN